MYSVRTLKIMRTFIYRTNLGGCSGIFLHEMLASHSRSGYSFGRNISRGTTRQIGSEIVFNPRLTLRKSPVVSKLQKRGDWRKTHMEVLFDPELKRLSS